MSILDSVRRFFSPSSHIEIDVIEDEVSPKVFHYPKNKDDFTHPEGSIFLIKLKLTNNTDEMIEFNRSKLSIENGYIDEVIRKYYDLKAVEVDGETIIFQSCEPWEVFPRIYHSGPIAPNEEQGIIIPHFSFSILPETTEKEHHQAKLTLISDYHNREIERKVILNSGIFLPD